LGILAGGGTLPFEIAAHAQRTQRPVHMVALKGEADPGVASYPHTWVNWGQIGGMVAAMRKHGCRELVLAGTVRRPNLWTLRPDLGLLLALPRLFRTLQGGDDSVLRRVIGFFEHKGFTVVGVADVAPHLLASTGPLGSCSPTPTDEAAIVRGLALLDALGAFDVGQAVVATADQIVAIEGAGGTDAMLGQISNLDMPGAVLVKWPKPGQELRLDLPAIGPRTVALAKQAKLAGIAVQAGGAVILEREVLRAAADGAGVFVSGRELEQRSAYTLRSATSAAVIEAASRHEWHMRTRRIPTAGERLDIAIGCRLLAALATHLTAGSAVIARQHVLAVAASESTLAVIDRAAGLRQWGAKGRRRVGTLMLRDSENTRAALADAAQLAALVERTVAARLAGIVLVTGPVSSGEIAPLVDRLNAAGLFLVTVEGAT
jgi:UDP-2,3-diacylglucosamine hydrolase